MFRWESMTPFEAPVVPDEKGIVKIVLAGSKASLVCLCKLTGSKWIESSVKWLMRMECFGIASILLGSSGYVSMTITRYLSGSELA